MTSISPRPQAFAVKAWSMETFWAPDAEPKVCSKEKVSTWAAMICRCHWFALGWYGIQAIAVRLNSSSWNLTLWCHPRLPLKLWERHSRSLVFFGAAWQVGSAPHLHLKTKKSFQLLTVIPGQPLATKMKRFKSHPTTSASLCMHRLGTNRSCISSSGRRIAFWNNRLDLWGSQFCSDHIAHLRNRSPQKVVSTARALPGGIGGKGRWWSHQSQLAHGPRNPHGHWTMNLQCLRGSNASWKKLLNKRLRRALSWPHNNTTKASALKK